MYNMMRLLEEIHALRLDILNQDWVQGIYYSEFLEFGDFPPEYESILESIDIRTVFRNIMKAVDNWLTSVCDEEKSWAALSPHVEHQKLLAILAYYIDFGTKNILTKEYRNNAILASCVYYKFLSISGYKAYHIYHSQLFAHSLACLGFPKAVCDQDNNFNNRELTKEVNSIIKELRNYVLDLRSVIETLQLNPTDMNFEDILSNLVDITGGAIVNKLNIDKIEFANISRVIYEIIDILLCNAEGEPNTVAIRLLFKCILPKLVAASADSRNNNNLVRASYVTYSGLLLSKYGKAALSGYTVLLEYLCYTQDGLEKAEVRQARVSLVVGLMSLLPQKSYRSVVKWILQLSNSSKISHRHIAMELLSNLLSNDPEEEKPNALQAILEPVAKPVEPTNESTEQPAGENQPPAEGPPAEGDAAPVAEDTQQPENVGATDENSQDSQTTESTFNLDHEVSEEDVAGLLRQRAHTVPYSQILLAVYERVNDASSTLRTRAYTIFAECLNCPREPMKQAIRELNGTGEVARLMALAAKGVCDERAAVRKAALSLVQRSLASVDAPPPTAHDLGLLIGLCRDASIVVRAAAISALSELTAQRPAQSLVDAFLNGPMHQLSDPETKIQDQVVNLIQHLLIDRLQKYVEGNCPDQLPWMFLNGIVRHNIRKYLQKACGLLAKNTKCINHRLVDILSTHLGVAGNEHDLQTLVLLTSIAKHVEYKELEFLTIFYYKIADEWETGAIESALEARRGDGRVLALTLELLGAWTCWIRPAMRATLRDYLVRRLALSTDDGCRLMSATLAAHLDPHNLSWASEMLQLAESRAQSSNDVEEWVRAADLALVAPDPPPDRLLHLFIGAISDPPAEWSGAALGTAVAGLGRLCVRSRAAAAAAAPDLAALLHDHSAPLAPKLNALLALTDICTRYTCIVEPLLESVCSCLSPSAPSLLRRATSRSLTRLLLAGYLRLRTPLYYRFCALLADEEHEVREPAEYYVTTCLPTETIYHHFVDCVLHYNNDYTEGMSFECRQLIYDVMLQRLSIVQKLNLQCRLARDVLEHAADVCDERAADEDLPPPLHAALLDTITLLCGPRMKLPRKPQRDGDAADIEDLQERITTNIVSHKMKRTVAEVVVPAVLRLYSRLRDRGGQLNVYLVRIANDLLVDYRQEIEELIDIDEELVGRIRHFQETIGDEPSFGNSRNLVTTSTSTEPETPRGPRRRGGGRAAARSPPRKRALRV